MNHNHYSLTVGEKQQKGHYDNTYNDFIMAGLISFNMGNITYKDIT